MVASEERMFRRIAAVLLTSLSLATGCAQVTITELDKNAKYTDGLPFYLGHPYLAVAENEGKCMASVVYLPDKSKRYVARLVSGIGTANLQAKLEGGMMLTEFGGATDSKAAEIIVAAIGGVATAAAADLIGPSECKQGLYAIEFATDGRVSQLKRIPLIVMQ